MSEVAGVSIVVVTKQEDQTEAINTALRDTGYAAHCHRTGKPADLESAIAMHAADMAIVFEPYTLEKLQPLLTICAQKYSEVPIILVAENADEEAIAAGMSSGARDVVSLSNISRLQSVCNRELQACKLGRDLQNFMDSADQYKNQLNSLKQSSVEAIADIQEGIIVNANPAWLEMFGLSTDDDLTGHPIMDLCATEDRAALKGALVACLRGKWQDSKLNINGLKPDQAEFPAGFCLESIEFDGEPAVRMLVAPEIAETKTPVSLIEQALQRDQLTGLFNRAHFVAMCAQRLDKPPEGGVRAIAYVRPDKFARANTDVGLDGTESVLAQFAQLLRDYSQPTDIYGRFGGTMFAVMLERGTMADAEAWAEQFIQNVAESVFEYDEKSTAITCSIGLCETDSDTAKLPSLLHDAERACHSARRQGGNRFGLSESSGAAKKIRQDDSLWVPRIRGALMENRLRLEHQPVASLNSEIESAYDTLVRMMDEEGNTILPSEFLPVAERTGLTKNIDRWVIGASMTFCASNNPELVFVRLSRDSVLDKTLVDWLDQRIAETAIETKKLCFEISEEVAVKHLRQTQELSETLRKRGFLFALEHFGKGDHANRIFARVPMDFAKIDGSLMQGLHKNTNLQTKVKELARLANDNSVQTIAERVQDANTMAVLWQLGISFIQGNYVQKNEIVIEDTSQTSATTMALQLPADAEEEKPAAEAEV